MSFGHTKLEIKLFTLNIWHKASSQNQISKDVSQGKINKNLFKKSPVLNPIRIKTFSMLVYVVGFTLRQSYTQCKTSTINKYPQCLPHMKITGVLGTNSIRSPQRDIFKQVHTLEQAKLSANTNTGTARVARVANSGPAKPCVNLDEASCFLLSFFGGLDTALALTSVTVSTLACSCSRRKTHINKLIY